MVRTMVTQVLQLEMEGVEPLVALQGRERLLDALGLDGLGDAVGPVK